MLPAVKPLPAGVEEPKSAVGGGGVEGRDVLRGHRHSCYCDCDCDLEKGKEKRALLLRERSFGQRV